MGLADTANLGFKTSRDKVGDLSRPFNTDQDVRNGVVSITGLLANARSKKPVLHVQDMVRPLLLSLAER